MFISPSDQQTKIKAIQVFPVLFLQPTVLNSLHTMLMGRKILPKLHNLNAEGNVYNLLMQCENYFHFIVIHIKCPERKQNIKS